MSPALPFQVFRTFTEPRGLRSIHMVMTTDLANYLPMQKLPKIRFRMSSAVVAPVTSSNWRNDP
jgi:hypothetical protein